MLNTYLTAAGRTQGAIEGGVTDSRALGAMEVTSVFHEFDVPFDIAEPKGGMLRFVLHPTFCLNTLTP